jgi:hypothetical protein
MISHVGSSPGKHVVLTPTHNQNPFWVNWKKGVLFYNDLLRK